MNCGALFQSDLEGVRALLPDFLFIGLKRVLPNIQPGFQLFPSVAVDDLRKSAYKILGQVISIPNRFPNVMSRFVGSGILGEHLNTDSALGEHSLLPKLVKRENEERRHKYYSCTSPPCHLDSSDLR